RRLRAELRRSPLIAPLQTLYVSVFRTIIFIYRAIASLHPAHFLPAQTKEAAPAKCGAASTSLKLK
ncbi:hypothetical protein B4N84_17030, partial [Flavobacterium sp. IR1]